MCPQSQEQVRTLEELTTEADKLRHEILRNIETLNRIKNYRNSVSMINVNDIYKGLSVN